MDNMEIAFSEVYEIINLMSYDLRRKIPQKFIELVKEQRNEIYKPKIERGIPLEKQELKEETIGILAFLKLNCFCTEEEKEQFVKLLNENEKKFQKEINEKYNSQDIFKKSSVIEEEKIKTTKNEIQIINNNETFFKKIKKIILRLLHIEE